MSRHSQPLSQFLASVRKAIDFPLSELNSYLSRTPPPKQQCLIALNLSMTHFHNDCLNFKEASVAIWLCGARNYSQSLEQSLQFFQSLMRSRLLLLIFDREGKFILDKVLLFFKEPLEMTIKRALQAGLGQRLMKTIRGVNQNSSTFNEVLFLLELLLVRNIQNNLQPLSLQEFTMFLRATVSQIKMQRINSKSQAMIFRLTALLRNQQDSCETYQLQCKQNKLIKQIDKGSLMYWVVDAFVRTPKQVDMTTFNNSRNILEVLSFYSQLEVFASSPLVQDPSALVQDQYFVSLFQRFLMGEGMGEGKYQYGCAQARQTIESLRDRLSKQNIAYQRAIKQETLNKWKCNGQ